MEHVRIHHGVKRLTPLAVKNERSGDRRREIPDAGTGLYLVVQPKPSGAKSWAVRYRYLDAPKKLTLGRALIMEEGEAEPQTAVVGGPLTLAAARKLAQDALHQVKLGKDPAVDKKQGIASARTAAIGRAADSVEAVKDRFIKLHVAKKNRPSTLQQVERILDTEVLPVWKGKSIHDITKEDVLKLLDDIAEDRPTLANRTLAIIRKWFNWMIDRNIIKTVSPCAGVKPPSGENPRERVLSTEEIKSLWHACNQVGVPFGPFVKLLLLTGQRRSEVAGMRWSEIDDSKRTWTLPGERTKNGVQHTIPLSAQAWTIINSLPRIKDGDTAGDYVMSTTGSSGIAGFSKAKRQLDKLTQLSKPWTYHDIRRSVVTHLAEGWPVSRPNVPGHAQNEQTKDDQENFSVAPHVIEAVVNHISGHKTGVAGIYNRATYAVEKKAALEKWADRLDEIIKDAPVAEDSALAFDPAAKVIRPKFGARR
jgi:integrase